MAVHGFGQSDNNLIKENNCYSNRCMLNETYNKKIRLAKFRTLYCTNTVMMRVQHGTKQSVVTVKNLFHFLWQYQPSQVYYI